MSVLLELFGTVDLLELSETVAAGELFAQFGMSAAAAQTGTFGTVAEGPPAPGLFGTVVVAQIEPSETERASTLSERSELLEQL